MVFHVDNASLTEWMSGYSVALQIQHEYCGQVRKDNLLEFNSDAGHNEARSGMVVELRAACASRARDSG